MPIYESGGRAFWPPMPTDDEMSVAQLSRDGAHVAGWVKIPDKVWRPQEGDLLWRPPGAKATDIDSAGTIVDVVELGEKAWITAQLQKRAQYLDVIKARVRSGALKLTAAVAAMLGMDFGDGAQLVTRTGTGTLAYKRAIIAEGRRLSGAHESWCTSGHSLAWSCATDIGSH